MSEGLGPDFSRDEVFLCRFPVHRACRDGDVGALVSLLQQLSDPAQLTAEDPCYGWTPVHWAAHYGQLECVVRLVQMGCEVNTVSSRFNQTPTHAAAFGGHPHCLLWLTQAGADVNRQDLVGEAPLHKAARSGSLECIQVLLIAGAKPHLRNGGGQTAADLAHAHGFLDCFCFISKTKKHLLQLNVVQNGSRKRLLAAVDTGHMKKARGGDNVVQVQSGDEEEESISMELNSADEDDITASTNSHLHTPPHSEQDEPLKPSPPSPPDTRRAPPPPPRHSPADMCGSLHLSVSPGSCVSHRPAWRGPMGGDCADFLHYGHYNGFGDTAEELSDGGWPWSAPPTCHTARRGVTAGWDGSSEPNITSEQRQSS